MKIKTALITILVSVLLPTYAAAQDGLKNTDDLASSLARAYASVDQKEIRIDGVIGTYIGDQLYFADEFGRYRVELDAGREVRRKIEGCELDFDVSKSPCKITGMVEVRVDKEVRNVADGIEIELILYQVDSFDRPE